MTLFRILRPARRLWLVAVVGAGVFLPTMAGAADPPAVVPVADGLAPVLAAAMAGTKVPAMGMLVIRDGRVVAQAERGLRRNDGNSAVGHRDDWHIGSNGKALTVAMVARLADRGVLSWTRRLDAMLPALAGTMNPQYRGVTLVQLLSHHSGLPHDIVDEAVLKQMLVPSGKSTVRADREAYIARALRDAPVGPTSDFNYSNTGLLIAAVIAEHATGKPYEQLVRQEVFQPLRMQHVGFGQPPAGQPRGHVAGKPIGQVGENPDFVAPAGNMYMPLSDWALFCIDQLRGAKGQGRLLKPESYRLMQTAQPGGGGLGWGVQPSVAGRQGPVLVHVGSDGSWYAIVALFPDSGNGLLIAANAGEDMGGDAAGRAAFKPIVDTLAPPVR